MATAASRATIKYQKKMGYKSISFKFNPDNVEIVKRFGVWCKDHGFAQGKLIANMMLNAMNEVHSTPANEVHSTCKECGKAISPNKRKGTMYCDDPCRKKFNDRARRLKKKQPLG